MKKNHCTFKFLNIEINNSKIILLLYIFAHNKYYHININERWKLKYIYGIAPLIYLSNSKIDV